MKKNILLMIFIVLSYVIWAAGVPQQINYQGKVEVNGVPFDGVGQFKFAITNQAGDTYYWTNDGSTPIPPAEPDNAVSLTVSGGLLNVGLGDSSHPNMTVISPTVFENQDTWLRIWFNDGSTGFQKLNSDQKLASVPYAMMAQSVPDDSISGEKLKRESIWPEHEGRSNTIVSFYAHCPDKSTAVPFDFDPSTPEIDPVETGKTFIITDITFGSSNTVSELLGDIKIYYIKDSVETVLFAQKQKYGIWVSGGYYSGPTHVAYKSGLPVPEGAELFASCWLVDQSTSVTVAGFEFSN